MAAWPSTLPSPLMDSYSIEPEDPLVRTDFESGPARVRRRYTAAPSLIRGKIRLTKTQFGIFEKFHKNDLKDGAESITSMPMLNGVGISLVTARCVGMWSASVVPQSNVWDVVIALEVASRPLPA